MAKIISFKKACALSKKLRKEGKKVVFTAGCFDIIHIGHIEFFRRLRKYYGSEPVVFVGVETDKYIVSRKGKSRPIFNQKIRAKVLESIEAIDYVILLTYTTNYKRRFKTLNPNSVTFGNNEFTKMISDELSEVHIDFKHLPHKIKKSSTSKIIKILLDNFSS